MISSQDCAQSGAKLTPKLRERQRRGHRLLPLPGFPAVLCLGLLGVAPASAAMQLVPGGASPPCSLGTTYPPCYVADGSGNGWYTDASTSITMNYYNGFFKAMNSGSVDIRGGGSFYQSDDIINGATPMFDALSNSVITLEGTVGIGALRVDQTAFHAADGGSITVNGPTTFGPFGLPQLGNGYLVVEDGGTITFKDTVTSAYTGAALATATGTGVIDFQGGGSISSQLDSTIFRNTAYFRTYTGNTAAGTIKTAGMTINATTANNIIGTVSLYNGGNFHDAGSTFNTTTFDTSSGHAAYGIYNAILPSGVTGKYYNSNITLNKSSFNMIATGGSVLYNSGVSGIYNITNQSVLAGYDPTASGSLVHIAGTASSDPNWPQNASNVTMNVTDSTLTGGIFVRYLDYTGTNLPAPSSITLTLDGNTTWGGRAEITDNSIADITVGDTAKWTGSVQTALASSARTTVHMKGTGKWVVTDQAVFNDLTFDGGTVQADIDSLAFANGVNVGAGGGTVDTQAYDMEWSGVISGGGALDKIGDGKLTLTDDSSGFTGSTTVSAGTLMVNGGKLGGSMQVNSGAKLGGLDGTVGKTTVDGTLLGEDSAKLTFNGDLRLNSGSTTQVSLGGQNSASLFNVNGNLILGGTLQVDNVGGFGPGYYRLFDYTGTLSGAYNTLNLAGETGIVQTSVPKQVNLCIGGPCATTSTYNYWRGGDGIWDHATSNWTPSLTSTQYGAWQDGLFAFFLRPGGTVTVENSGVATSGMQFGVDGYNIQGGPITLTDPRSIIRTGMGTVVTATIASELTGSGGLEKEDLGTLILTHANSYRGGTFIDSGTLSVSSDENLGESTGALTFDGGTLQVTDTKFGSTSRTINWGAGGGGFDIVEAKHTFDVSQNLSGGGDLHKLGAGTLNLTGTNTYTGQTTVEQGVLAVNGSITSETIVEAAGTLAGAGQVGEVVNYGIVSPGNSIGTLTVNGDYSGKEIAGKNGMLAIEAVLGGDDSPTDLLTVTGATSGITGVVVTNLNGQGAQTHKGIKIIQVDGASNGKFQLLSDLTLNGHSTVVGGAYAYRLFKGGVDTPVDGDWYLRSRKEPQQCQGSNCPPPPCQGDDCPQPPQPQYQPGVPIYEAYAQVLQELNDVGTLRQRVGNRYWGGAANTTSNEGAAHRSTPGAATEPRTGAASDPAPNVWGRIESAHGRFEPGYATTVTRYDIDTYQMQAGIDGQFYEGEMGRLIAGFTAHYGHARADIGSEHGMGNIEADGYGVGGTLTWYGENGLYADAQAQTTWYRNDLTSHTAHRSLASNDGFGYALSLEGGKRFSLDGVFPTAPSWVSGMTLTPQAQITWSAVQFDGFNDTFGAHVTHNETDSLKGRFGISADYDQAWRDTQGRVTKANIYAIANLYYEFQGVSKIKVGGTPFASQNERLWGGIGGGGTYAWADGRYALYGEVTVDTSLKEFSDSYRLNGNLGLKVRW